MTWCRAKSDWAGTTTRSTGCWLSRRSPGTFNGNVAAIAGRDRPNAALPGCGRARIGQVPTDLRYRLARTVQRTIVVAAANTARSHRKSFTDCPPVTVVPFLSPTGRLWRAGAKLPMGGGRERRPQFAQILTLGSRQPSSGGVPPEGLALAAVGTDVRPHHAATETSREPSPLRPRCRLEWDHISCRFPLPSCGPMRR